MSHEITPSLILVKSSWAKMPSFSMIPATNDCPYIEVMFNPHAKLLAIIGKTKKQTFHTVNRLDENGNPIDKKGAKVDSQAPYQTQRISQETYTEYYISDMKDIEEFIKNFSINAETFDYTSVLETETMDDPDTSGIIKPSLIIT